MALDEHLFFERRKGFQRLGVRLLHLGQSFHGGLHKTHHLESLGFFGPTGEGFVADVAGEADTAADDDLAVWAVAGKPLAGIRDDA